MMYAPGLHAAHAMIVWRLSATPTRHLGVHVRVQQAAGDVVHDVRAGLNALPRHLSVVGVDRDRDAAQLLGLCQRPAHAGKHLPVQADLQPCRSSCRACPRTSSTQAPRRLPAPCAAPAGASSAPCCSPTWTEGEASQESA